MPMLQFTETAATILRYMKSGRKLLDIPSSHQLLTFEHCHTGIHLFSPLEHPELPSFHHHELAYLYYFLRFCHRACFLYRDFQIKNMSGFTQSTTSSWTCIRFLLAALVPMVAIASDSDPVADFCVADPASTILVNGLVCKDPATVTANDFVFHGLAKAGNTAVPAGSAAQTAFVAQFPGLNTLGISMARLDYAKGGLVAPHTHPRATEITYVVEGSLYVGFVDTTNKLFATTVHQGDVYVVPRGVVRFELNVGDGPAMAIAALNSQNPGVQPIPNALFGSGISDAVLQKAFSIDKKTVQYIKSKFATAHS